MSRPSPRRGRVLAAVLALPLTLTLAGCGNGESSAVSADASAPTGSASSTPSGAASGAAPTAPSSPAASQPAGGAAADADLVFRTSMLAAAFNSGDFGAVWDIACPGIRKGDSRDAYAAALADAPHVGLAHPSVVDAPADGAALAELGDPGVATDAQQLVRFDVTPGSANPNPTMTARFVHSAAGWLYCGMTPEG